MVREGHAASLVELAMRFAIANPALSTTLVGIANLEQFEAAASAALKGPLSPAALARLGGAATRVRRRGALMRARFRGSANAL